MNIIANDCVGGELYKLYNEKFNNPFMWSILPINDFIRLYGGFDGIDFNNIEYVETPNYAFPWPMSSIRIDGKVNVYYPHYQKDLKNGLPVLDTAFHGNSNIKYKEIKQYTINKYRDRLSRMSDDPIFVYSQSDWDSNEDLERLLKTRSKYKLILITNNEKYVKYVSSRVQCIIKEQNEVLQSIQAGWIKEYLNDFIGGKIDTNHRRTTISVSPGGRLGNMLFICAAGAYHAVKYGTNYSFVPSPDCHNIAMTYKDNLLGQINIVPADSVSEIDGVWTSEKDSLTYSEIPNANANILFIDGWRQCPKYWGNDKNFVNKLFQTDKDELIKDAIRKTYNNIDLNEYIAISVRMGDYRDDANTRNVLGYLGPEYYYNAMKKFPENSKYIIVSDDIEACKEIFSGDNFIFADREVNIEGIGKDLIDLFILRMAKANIISNSTFAWWGAYLNFHKDRKVICPYPFFKYTKSDIIVPENDNWETEGAIFI